MKATLIKSLLAATCLVATPLATTAAASELTPVSLGLNWVAQPEFGGFYQAKAEGRYEACGLDVTIVAGGPGINNRLQMSTGNMEFYLGGNLIQTLRAKEQGVPTLVVAGIFQKEPQVLMSHPGQGLDTWDSLKDAPIALSRMVVATVFPWMKEAHGFSEENLQPYSFSAAPFIADKGQVRQGYVTSEPLAVQREGGFEPNVFLISDHGFDTYGMTIETTRDMVSDKPEQVTCFVNASIEGWNSYLYGDPSAANALIQQDNPDMSDEQVEFSHNALISYGIVDSGLSEENGIGALSAERIENFLSIMQTAGIFPAELTAEGTYTLNFVNQGVGLDIKAQAVSQ